MYFYLFVISLIALGISYLGRHRFQWYFMNVLMRLGALWYGIRPPKHGLLPPQVQNPPKSLPSPRFISFDRTIRFVASIIEKPHQPIILANVRKAFDSFAFGIERDIYTQIRTVSYWRDEKEQLVNMELYTPPAYESHRLIIFSHGGGLYAGHGLHTHRHALGELARRTRTRVLAVDYRVIPEVRYDSPLHDCIHAWEYATNKEWGMGISPRNIIVAGESAGGTLTTLLITTLQRRSEYKSNETLPRAAMLISTFDFSNNESPSRQSNGIPYPNSVACDPIISAHILKWNTELLTTCGAEETDGRYYSPTYQAQQDVTKYGLEHPFAGFPPTFIQCGVYETLIDDSRALAQTLTQAGVHLTTSFPEWYIHMQFLLAGLYPEADASLQELADYVNVQFASK